jgi:hypothetical protein
MIQAPRSLSEAEMTLFRPVLCQLSRVLRSKPAQAKNRAHINCTILTPCGEQEDGQKDGREEEFEPMMSAWTSNTGFLDLPRELRDQIYELVLPTTISALSDPSNAPEIWHISAFLNPNQPALAKAHRIMRQEFLPLWYSQQEFSLNFTVHKNCHGKEHDVLPDNFRPVVTAQANTCDWLAKLLPSHVGYIRHLILRFFFEDDPCRLTELRLFLDPRSLLWVARGDSAQDGVRKLENITVTTGSVRVRSCKTLCLAGFARG